MTDSTKSIAPEHWRIERTIFPRRYIIQYSYDGKEWVTFQDDIKNYPLYFKDFKSAKSHLDTIITLNFTPTIRSYFDERY